MPESLTGPVALNTPFSTVRSISPSVMSMPGKASFSAAFESLAATFTTMRFFGTLLISGMLSLTFSFASAVSFEVSKPVWRMRLRAG